MSDITEFYLNGGQDHKGRTFDTMLKMTDEELESSHDVVQWLFPLNEASRHSKYAPIITAEDVKALATPEGQKQYMMAWQRFMSFYGMKIKWKDSGDVEYIIPDGHHPLFGDFYEEEDTGTFHAKADDWMTPFNHNLKRITRIIRCAMLLKLQTLAVKTNRGFLDAKDYRSHVPVAIDDTVVQFWSDAINMPIEEKLNISPQIRNIFRHENPT